MPVLSALWELIKRDYLNAIIVAPPVCNAKCNYAIGIYESMRLVPALCASDGIFGKAMISVYDCISKYTDDNTGTTVVLLERPLSYCHSSPSFQQALSELASAESAISSSESAITSSKCALYSSAESEPPSDLICSTNGNSSITTTESIVPLITTIISTMPLTTFTTPVESSATPAMTSSSAAGSTSSALPEDNGLSKVDIAGVAVGATIGIILLIASVVFFAWWYRRRRRNEKATIAEKKRLQETTEAAEKAQLHSDEYRPHREELEGSKVPLRVRTIEGLHEVEYQDLTSIRSEMSANEIAAAELDRSLSNKRGTESTLVNSDSPGSQRHRD